VALGVAVALQLGVNFDTVRQLSAAALHKLAGRPALPPNGEPPADPVQRASYYADRAAAGDAGAQLALAVLYAKGDGVEQDYATAAKWFRAAAEHGVMRAQYDLGVLYERGRGVPLDFAQAAAWYRKAAEQEHPLAQYNLAVAFTKGQGVRRDFFEAAVWYHRAAAQGVVAAMVNLAILYERGEGVETSVADAYAWYRAAARRGSQPAARRAEELLRAFSPVEQTRAEAKTVDINASIRDAVGERARQALKNTQAQPAAADGDAAGVLKSGIEARWNSPGGADTTAENP
jgi:TPR repeat protein